MYTYYINTLLGYAIDIQINKKLVTNENQVTWYLAVNDLILITQLVTA